MKMIITPIFGSKIDNLQFESRNVSQITSDIEKYWKRSYEKNL